MSKKVPKAEGSDEASPEDPAALTPASRLAAFASSRGRYYAVILAVFSAVLIISNISATKVIGFGPIVTDGGAFLFPIAYILGDVISEVYGFKAARKAVITGFGLQILATFVFWLVLISPPGPGYENQDAFAAVLGFYPRIVAASLVGYFFGQLLNSYVLVAVKKRMGEQKLWVRLLTSTGVGEFVDTLLFCVIAFAGVIPGLDFINYIVFGFVYKVAVEVILMPVTYRVINLVKKHEPSYELHGGSEDTGNNTAG
ncbi:MAG: queuosine precursor transporter [Brevibacterium sp.]|uniref:queuosine precursor transporter n=1 Tax=Brevibacterium sp. TaxID=1701 RepID=UPI002648D042|nr:queuosine precursor transporter [Brevibacterium sp.]MDN5834919.1 queuosine precursor transporter [Brevibacterium sp.]MDN6134094.1 queuosine precursor transporter [Brevibacterium sp.]MDN6157768.1 queuosine precursor transporter [Brevibacterium sp.]MDN6176254.1 queuosine precursor transporter [Brevibacterium sp.]MDN6191994.1 queuosine precursor transporter [Brevibacterium sp.]